MNVEDTIKAKSDQLNADDLVGGPICVRIEGVREGSGDQKVIVQISGGHQPWKPCKTCRRILAATMGLDASKWVGTWVELYRDPAVKWAGKPVGGIRIRALSCIDSPKHIALTETKGQKREHEILPLKPPSQTVQAPAPKTGDTLNEEQVCTIVDLLGEFGGRQKEIESRMLAGYRVAALEDLPAAKYASIIARLEQMRAEG